MTRKRFKKLQMSLGYSRDEAEILAKLACFAAALDEGMRYYHEADLYVACGYEFFINNCVVADEELARIMKECRRLKSHGRVHG